MKEGTATLSAGTITLKLKEGTGQLKDDSGQLLESQQELADGSQELATGAQTLYRVARLCRTEPRAWKTVLVRLTSAGDFQSGAGELESGAGQLQSGVSSLQNGAQNLSDGLTDGVQQNDPREALLGAVVEVGLPSIWITSRFARLWISELWMGGGVRSQPLTDIRQQLIGEIEKLILAVPLRYKVDR